MLYSLFVFHLYSSGEYFFWYCISSYILSKTVYCDSSHKFFKSNVHFIIIYYIVMIYMQLYDVMEFFTHALV